MDDKKIYKKFEAKLEGWRFVIEEDFPEVGWYLYVYKGTKGVADHLQDSLDIIKSQAFEDYGVPIDSWYEIDSV
jgi:hypothetical protein